jgi:hypothetical protein
MKPNKKERDGLEQICQEAVGRASMCWETPEGAGVFDSEDALKVAKDLTSAIRTYIAGCLPKEKDDMADGNGMDERADSWNACLTAVKSSLGVDV